MVSASSGNYVGGSDHKAYTTLIYANGPGATGTNSIEGTSRHDPLNDDTSKIIFIGGAVAR